MNAPITAPDCDLRDFAFMPLDATRLLDSDLFALATGDEFKAAIALWCKAWTQIPAGSLPDDDRVLAHLSGAGAKWKKVKDMALRGFLKCDDGRLYHPVVCEKANEAWGKKQSYRDRSKKGNAKRWGSQKDEQQASPKDAVAIPKGVLERPKGQQQGQGQEDIVGDDAGAIEIAVLTDELARMARVRHVDPGRIGQHMDLVREWIDHGATADDMRDAVREGITSASAAIHSLKYFSGAVRLKVAKRENEHGSSGEGSAAEQSGDGILRAAAIRRAARRAEQQAERA